MTEPVATEHPEDFCPHGVHKDAPCDACADEKHGTNEPLASTHRAQNTRWCGPWRLVTGQWLRNYYDPFWKGWDRVATRFGPKVSG